jgi:hypothetical protein
MADVATINVPMSSYTATGFVPPLASAVLAGVQADMNAAFGTALNFGTPTNPTPQGQIATTNAAALNQVFAQFCILANSVDPAFAFGRMQDAIGRIYFIARIPGQSTAVSCVCIGDVNTVIPPGTLAKDTANNIYYAVSGGTIPASGTLTLQFQNQVGGPIPCPSGTLNILFNVIPGWDTINNPTDGVLGTNVETRSAFEARRQATVQKNSTGFVQSIEGQLLGGGDAGTGVNGVLDAYVTDNDNNYTVGKSPKCVIQGSISGTTLLVTSVVSGQIVIGQSVTGSESLGVSVANGTVITAQIDATHWTVNNTQTVAATTMNLGGVLLPANSLYCAVIGGADTDVATAIFSKKSAGCSYYPGNSTVTIYDSSVQYPPPGVPYVVVFQRPPSLPFVVQVNIANGPNVPSDATTQIQAAVIAAFAGTDGYGLRAKIGFPLYANRFYRGINALGDWAEIVSLFLGTPDAPAATVTAAMGATFTATGSGNVLTVSGIGAGQFLSIGDTVFGTGIGIGAKISSYGTGTGGNGTYNISSSVGGTSGAMSTISSVLNVTAVASGTLAVKQILFDTGGHVSDGTQILSQIAGTAGGVGQYSTSGNQQIVASETVFSVLATMTVVPVTINEAPTVTLNCIKVNLV